MRAACTPRVPEAFAGKDAVHTSDWRTLGALAFAKRESVLVVGGGLSAAQAALRALKRGAGRVVLCSRRPLEAQARGRRLSSAAPLGARRGRSLVSAPR